MRGERHSIRLGDATRKQAETWLVKIEDLLAARKYGHKLDSNTVEWIAQLPAGMRDKLTRLGLIAPAAEEKINVQLTLGSLIDDFIEHRTEIKPTTKNVWRHTATNLCEFFGRGRLVRTITAYDAEQWRRELDRLGFAEATARKRSGVARQFFGAAIKRRAIEENPFASLKCAAIANDSRRFFITRPMADRIMEACKDFHPEWSLIFALARYGGLRTPSETLALTWSDITRDRMVVHSSKTVHQGKAERVVPLFPELREPLQHVRDQHPGGSDYVITRYRQANCNLRTQFLRILERAAIPPWPKLFQNLRSTRETELVEIYPLHVVTTWLGNSAVVAAKHYLQVTDDHYSQASEVQKTAQLQPAKVGKTGFEENPTLSPPAALHCVSGEVSSLHDFAKRRFIKSAILPGAVSADADWLGPACSILPLVCGRSAFRSAS